LKWKDFYWGKMNLKAGNYKLRVSATHIPAQYVAELYGMKIKKMER